MSHRERFIESVCRDLDQGRTQQAVDTLRDEAVRSSHDPMRTQSFQSAVLEINRREAKGVGADLKIASDAGGTSSVSVTWPGMRCEPGRGRHGDNRPRCFPVTEQMHVFNMQLHPVAPRPYYPQGPRGAQTGPWVVPQGQWDYPREQWGHPREQWGNQSPRDYRPYYSQRNGASIGLGLLGLGLELRLRIPIRL